MHIALAGTRGVPAQYGGFETAVEEIGSRLVGRGHRVSVMCRNPGQTITKYKGMELLNLPTVRKKSLETLTHSFASLPYLLREKPDAVVFFNVANALPALGLKLRGIPYAIHVDGLEWQRSKWGRAGRWFYRVSEWIAVHTCRQLIADAVGIQDYYRDRFAKATALISYGAPTSSDAGRATNRWKLDTGGYYLVVARLEPENNVHMIISAYSNKARSVPLVVVGDAPYGNNYVSGLKLERKNVIMLGSVYDQAELDWLYANARAYLHGHSVGGTNPSLLRAGATGVPVIAYDTVFNAEVLADTGLRFASEDHLEQILTDFDHYDADRVEELGRGTQERIVANYDWSSVTDAYEALCSELADARRSVGDSLST